MYMLWRRGGCLRDVQQFLWVTRISDRSKQGHARSFFFMHATIDLTSLLLLLIWMNMSSFAMKMR